MRPFCILFAVALVLLVAPLASAQTVCPIATPGQCQATDCPCGPGCVCGPNCACATATYLVAAVESPRSGIVFAVTSGISRYDADAAAVLAIQRALREMRNVVPDAPSYATLWTQAYAAKLPLVVGIGVKVPESTKYIAATVDQLEQFQQGKMIVGIPNPAGGYWFDVVAKLPQDSTIQIVEASLQPKVDPVQAVRYVTACGPNGCQQVAVNAAGQIVSGYQPTQYVVPAGGYSYSPSTTQEVRWISTAGGIYQSNGACANGQCSPGRLFGR